MTQAAKLGPVACILQLSGLSGSAERLQELAILIYPLLGLPSSFFPLSVSALNPSRSFVNIARAFFLPGIGMLTTSLEGM